MSWPAWVFVIFGVYVFVGIVVGSTVYHLADPSTRWKEHEFHWACGYLWPLLALMLPVFGAGYGVFLLTGLVVSAARRKAVS